MADNGAHSSSLSSLSASGVPLFPHLNKEAPGADKHCGDSEYDSSILDLGSNELFGFLNRRNSHEDNPHRNSKSSKNASHHNNQYSGKSNTAMAHTDAPTLGKLKLESLCEKVDEGLDVSGRPPCSSISEEPITLNPRAIRALGAKLAVGDDRGVEHTQGKFKYVDMYENVLKTLDLNVSDACSVFGVSQLDEYNQFLRLSELNQQIQTQLSQNQLQEGSNVLAVLDAADFHKLYGNQDVAESKARTKSRFSFLPSWGSRRKRGKTEHPPTPVSQALGSVSGDSNSEGGPAHRPFLHRRLQVRHLQMISMGGTLGVGLYLNVGKAFTIAGSLGTVLAMVLVGLVVFATVISFCEMVTFVSVVDGVSGLSSRFVDESFGFAIGWLYFFSFAFGLAGEIVASVIILSYFPNTKLLTNAGSTAGFVTLFLGVCVMSNILSVRVFGEVEYFTSLVKVFVTLLGIVVMIVVNRGGIGDKGVIGFRYWDYHKSDFEHNLIFGLFRPTFNLFSTGTESKEEGIGGNLGRFLSLMVAVVVAAYAYSGTEIVCIAACEAKDPRKALPSATNKVFWRILLFYCLSSFVVSLNIYAGDPRLLRFYGGKYGASASQNDASFTLTHIGGAECRGSEQAIDVFGGGMQSPWIVAFQSAGTCSWSTAVNIILFFFALSCGNSHLYVSSRTIYSLSLQQKAPGFLRKCNRFGTPYFAVIASTIPALLSYTCVSLLATVVFQNLTSLISSSGVFVWFAMCLSFLRFYLGLKRRPDVIGRDDKAYPYRSLFQPYSAILGLFGSSVIMLSMGYVVFLKGCWNTWFFFSSYGTLIVFAILYAGHWAVKGSSFTSLEALDFDSGRREADIYIWDGGKDYNVRKVRDLARKVAEWVA